MKVRYVVLLALICLAGGWFGQQLVHGTCRPVYTIFRVVDGDTLVIVDTGGIRTKVRLRDFDAPEPDEPGGPEATAALEAQFPVGRRVQVTPHARDRYGRLIADVKGGT